MHPLFKKADSVSHDVIGAAIEVHRELGPGLLESIYAKCLMRELSLRGLQATSEETVKIEYKGIVFAEPLRFDLVVQGCLLAELKAIEAVLPIHKAQLFSYMKLLKIPLGLVINFHEEKLANGVHRLILPGSNVA